MKTKLIIFIVSFVVAVGGLTATAMLNSPKNVAARAISSLANDFLERAEIEGVSDIFDGGSIDFALTGIKKENVELMEDSAVKGKIYFSDGALMLSDYDLTFGGVRYQGDAYFSRDKIYFGEENVLGDTYGVDLSTLSDDFSGSIFAPGSGSYYELDEYTYETYTELFDQLKNNEELYKDFEVLVGKVGKDLWKIFANNVEFYSKSDEVRFGSKKTNVRLITIVVDDISMQDIVYDVYEYLSDSDDIYEFIEEHGKLIYSSEDGTDCVDLYEEWLEEIEDKLDSMCDYIDRYVGDVEIDITTPKLSKKLLKLEVRYNGDTRFTLDCGRDGVKKTDKITVETLNSKFTYKIHSIGKQKFEASISLADNDGEAASFSVLIDKVKGDYSVSLRDTHSDDTYLDYTLKGEFEEKNGAYIMSIDRFITREGYTNYVFQCDHTLECSFTIDTNDEMPEPEKNFKTIEDVTEEQLGKLESQLVYLLYAGSVHVHVDANDDYMCDMCRVGCSDGCDNHRDANDDGICDIQYCGKPFTDGCDRIHRDADDDGRCDYGDEEFFDGDECAHVDADDDAILAELL